MSTLCCAPGTPRHAPAVLHSQAGVLYEEPLIACLAVTVQRAEGLGTGPGSPARAAASAPSGSSLSLLSRVSSSGRRESPFLGGLLRRRRGKHGLARSTSLGSEASEEAAQGAVLAGEDAADECECAAHAVLPACTAWGLGNSRSGRPYRHA